MSSELAVSSQLASFSFNIRRLRVDRNLTQQQVADAVGTTRTTVSNWEKGVSYPYFLDLLKLANSLGASLNDLVALPSTAASPIPAVDAILATNRRIQDIVASGAPDWAKALAEQQQQIADRLARLEKEEESDRQARPAKRKNAS